MAKPTQPTMSSYLLDEAMHRFPAYPKATYRTESNIDIQEMLEEECQEFLDWQRTFVPSEREEEAKPFFAKPRPKLIDQLYCLELLRSVPDMVRRTLTLAKLSFKGIEMGPPLGYYVRQRTPTSGVGRTPRSHSRVLLSRRDFVQERPRSWATRPSTTWT